MEFELLINYYNETIKYETIINFKERIRKYRSYCLQIKINEFNSSGKHF